MRPDHGRVIVNDVDLTDANLLEWRHQIGYVIQDGGLFPHLTSRENVTLLASHLRRPTDMIDRRLIELADLVRLPTALLDRYPQELSGGQRQRVALLRALMLDPQVLFLDEPLGALDPMTRYALQGELTTIFEQLKKTVVLVTHDMNEAAYFADQILLMDGGIVVQSGTFDDLYSRPANSFVSEFIRAQQGLRGRSN